MISWFARNGVAANILMVFILAAGAYALLKRIPLEVFPTFQLDYINVRVPFRGATPAEVEEGVTIKVEEAIHDLEGIKSLISNASEGMGTVSAEVAGTYDARELMDDIKLRVDAISTFPEQTERPVIYQSERRREVITAVIFGDLSERELRSYGERVRDDIANLPGINQVELSGTRPYEVSIEVSEQTLRAYDLTLAQVAAAVSNTSIDLSAGAIKTSGGEVLIRTKGQAYDQEDFENIVVIKRDDGTRLTIADIATVIDGFEETPVFSRFNGTPAVEVDVYRVGDQSAIDVADAVKTYIRSARERFPAGVQIDYWRDRSRVVKARLNTLLNSAIQGGALIVLLLTLFLRFSVAFWVFVGVPVSFMGGLALMPELGLSINVISLFAFILVLGIVVDDAIVTGENIYTHLKKDPDPVQAAIAGTHEVAVPVTFGVLTTVAAFLPLMLIEGVRGKLFAQIPMIVVPVLLFSLIESKLILPAHLKHLKIKGDSAHKHNVLVRLQRRIADGLEKFVQRVYQPVLRAALRQRYFTLSVFVGAAIIVFSLASAGYVRFVFFPRVQSEVARGTLVMPVGTPFQVTERYIERMSRAAEKLRDKYIDQQTQRSVIRNILSTVGSAGSSGSGRSHIGRVMFEIVPPEERAIDITSSQLVREWRREIGPIPGVKEMSFRAEIGRGGSPVDVQLMGAEITMLQAAAAEIKQQLAAFPGVFDVSDSFEDGKEEIQLKIKPQAELLGLSSTDLARQVRQAFFGFDVQRIQRGREDVRVIVRYPALERQSLENLEKMRIRTAESVEIPFSEVAEASVGISPASIRRVDRNRTINITADINKETANIEAIKEALGRFVNELEQRYPGLRSSLEGEAREQRESFSSLTWGLAFVLFVVYTLLAIPFRSYSQPLMVMCVIPFGVVGAIVGHAIMGMNLSIISIMGMLALSGVVVNDSLVLVDYINRRRREGMTVLEAADRAGGARFRAVMLTSLTTFAGLMPLIFEKSTQAQFLIPMAVSLGFGILFATFITLILIPINYVILEEDIYALFRRLLRRIRPSVAH